MTEQFLHKYKAQFGQPVSYYKNADPTRTLPISFELEGNPDSPNEQYHNVIPQDIIEVSDHDMTFTISKTKTAGEGDSVTFYNLSENARKRLEANESGNPLFVLYAGYETDETLPLIFEGEVISSKQSWNGHTHITVCTLKTAASNIKEAYTARSYRAGESTEKVFTDLFRDMGLAIGLTNYTKEVIDKPLIVNGPTVDFVRKYAKNHGFVFTVHDGIVSFYKPEEVVSTTAHYIASSSNMIGSPTASDTNTAIQEKQAANRQAISVTTTLNGAYRINDLVEVNSREFKGMYTIESITHTGSYSGSDWFSRLELAPADGWERSMKSPLYRKFIPKE